MKKNMFFNKIVTTTPRRSCQERKTNQLRLAVKLSISSKFIALFHPFFIFLFFFYFRLRTSCCVKIELQSNISFHFFSLLLLIFLSSCFGFLIREILRLYLHYFVASLEIRIKIKKRRLKQRMNRNFPNKSCCKYTNSIYT